MDTANDIKHVIEGMSEAELRNIRSLVCERLRFLNQIRDLNLLQEFHVADQVAFNHNGESITGIVSRVNRRTVTVNTAGRGIWKVSPTLLTKVREGSTYSASASIQSIRRGL